MDSTESQFAYESPLQLTTLGFGECGDMYYPCHDDLNEQYIVEAERSQMPHVTQPRPQWIHYQQMYQTHVQCLTETNVAVNQEVLAFNQPGIVSGFRPSGTFLDLNLQEAEGTAVSEGLTYPMSQNNYSTNAEYYQFPMQNQHPYMSHSTLKPAPGLSSKQRSYGSKLNGMSADRARRVRIANRLDDLEELLPNLPTKGGKPALLDDVIDYVKYLQLQVKDLSQSRLGGEPVSNPLVFYEGYGHYIVGEEMKEPLEEMMGKLLEVNPLAATQLLESRGLFIRPIALAKPLQQPLYP